MRAVTIDKPGGFEVLRTRDVPAPLPGAGQVLIDVAFCGCNWADTQVRSGIYPHPLQYPLIPGFEVSGIVAKTGDDVTCVKTGDRVCAIASNGAGYAEQLVTADCDVMALPDAISLETGAAFPIQSLTAYHLLHTVYRIEPENWVLCHAIGGGVGLQVTQLAVHAGARVVGTTGTAGKQKRPLDFGARRVVNTADEDFTAVVMAETAGAGVDLAIDSLGARTLDRTFDVVRTLGHVVSIGEAEGEPFTNLRARILPKSLTFTRFHLLHVGPGSERWRRGQQYVMQGLIEGWLQVPIVAVFKLDQAARMHEYLESRRAGGKLLLAP